MRQRLVDALLLITRCVMGCSWVLEGLTALLWLAGVCVQRRRLVWRVRSSLGFVKERLHTVLHQLLQIERQGGGSGGPDDPDRRQWRSRLPVRVRLEAVAVEGEEPGGGGSVGKRAREAIAAFGEAHGLRVRANIKRREKDPGRVRRAGGGCGR